MDIETYALTKSPDYNKLKNRPFYEDVVEYKYDGVLEGKDSFSTKGITYVKISSDTPAVEELKNFYVYKCSDGGKQFPLGRSYKSDSTCFYDTLAGLVVVCYSTTINFNNDTVNVPSTGVYYSEGYLNSYYIAGLRVKKLDEKFLPDNIVVINPTFSSASGELYDTINDLINSGKNIYIRYNGCFCPLITIADSGTEYKLFFASAVASSTTGENTKLAYWYIQAVKDSTDDIYIKEAK